MTRPYYAVSWTAMATTEAQFAVADFEDELANMVATSPDRVRLEVAEMCRPGPGPECLRPVIA